MKGLIDSTLREGGQTPGVFFSLDEKISIAVLLDRIGIEEIELGVATVSDPDLSLLMRACREKRITSRLALWCRCVDADIRHAAQLDPDVISLSIPASDLHITQKFGRSRSWVLETLARSIQTSLELGVKIVSVGLEDGTRADRAFLNELVRTAARSGAARVRLADTVGIAGPAMISSLVGRIKKSCSLEIGVHTHNDFGMATANGIAALEAGAHWADATVLGLGERAGNSRLEEMAGYLALKSGDNRTYKTEYLRPLCLAVGRASGRIISPHHPLVGESIFTCETGLHLQGLVRDPATYEPYDPERVGGRRRLLVGAKAGKRAVQDRLHALGCSLPEDEMERVATLVRRQARLSKRSLHDEEILAIANA
ncbi:MAG: pyruvate carboxyltransferase [Thermodesulfobacteriota bacterium]|nr:pyruvate carboxyltransferase [Thermodesulfobacteriota bacterium]